MSLNHRRWLIAAILFAVLSRLALAAIVLLVRDGDTTAFHTEDSAQYLALGTSLARDGRFYFGSAPELFRVPGFPALVAIGMLLGAPTAFVIVAHALFGGFTVWCCFIAGRYAGDSRTGIAAAWLFALEPGQLAWSASILTDTLFVMFAAASSAAASRHVARGGAWMLVLAVLTAALSAYARPIGYCFPALILVACVGLRWRSTRQFAWRNALAGALTAVAVLAPWHARNFLTTGYSGFSTQFAQAVHAGAAATAISRRDGMSYEAVRQAMAAEAARPTRVATVQEMLSKGLGSIVSNPVSFTVTHASGVGAVLTHPGTSAFLRLFRTDERPMSQSVTQALVLGQWNKAMARVALKDRVYWLVTALLFAVNLGYLWCAAGGLRRAWTSPHIQLAATIVLVFLVLSGGAGADSRRRLPFLPALCVLAACYMVPPARSSVTRPWATTTAGSS